MVFDTALPSFGFRVSQGGTKTWVPVQSNPKRFITIGRFPSISLSKARDAAKKLIAEKTLARLQPKRISFNTAKDDFLQDAKKRNRPRTVADYTRLLKHFPFGSASLADITKRDIVKRLNLPPSEASHALVAAKVFFSWCIRHDYLERSPCEGLRAPQGHASRERVLSDEELAAVLSQAILEPYPWGPIVRLLILTGLRRTNVAQLRCRNHEKQAAAYPRVPSDGVAGRSKPRAKRAF